VAGFLSLLAMATEHDDQHEENRLHRYLRFYFLRMRSILGCINVVLSALDTDIKPYAPNGPDLLRRHRRQQPPDLLDAVRRVSRLQRRRPAEHAHLYRLPTPGREPDILMRVLGLAHQDKQGIAFWDKPDQARE
jgi:hypothetical protein